MRIRGYQMHRLTVDLALSPSMHLLGSITVAALALDVDVV